MAYRFAVGQWGIQPSEFWAMRVREWWWLYEDKRPRERYGRLSEDQVAELYDDLEAAQRKG